MNEENQTLKMYEALSKKIDNIPDIIKKEFVNSMTLCGIDAKDPLAMQELILWGKCSMEKEKQTSSRVRNIFTDVLVKGLIGLVVLGFITFYVDTLAKYVIREEQQAQHIVKKIDDKK